MHRSSSPFCRPITPCGIMSSDVNPNWASWDTGCRIVSSANNDREEAEAMLKEGDNCWQGDGGYPHELTLRIPSHPTINYMGWEMRRSDTGNPKTAEFYSGETIDTLQRVVKCQTLPGQGVQVWKSPDGIPTNHQFIKIIFSEPFSPEEQTIHLTRLYLFEEEPSIRQAGVSLTSLAEELGCYETGGRSPSPPENTVPPPTRRHRISSTGSKSSLAIALDGLGGEIRKLHKVRPPSPMRPTSGSPSGDTARSSPYTGYDTISHPSAARASLPKEPQYLDRDPAWLTVFRSYDDRLARCENQIQKILAIIEVRDEAEKAAAARSSMMVPSGGEGCPFPSHEMHALIINWVKPSLQKWAKNIEKRITKVLNNKIDVSFERITRATIDKKVKDILQGVPTTNINHRDTENQSPLDGDIPYPASHPSFEDLYNPPKPDTDRLPSCVPSSVGGGRDIGGGDGSGGGGGGGGGGPCPRAPLSFSGIMRQSNTHTPDHTASSHRPTVVRKTFSLDTSSGISGSGFTLRRELR
eukprot:TRINITY_DN3344_c0_g1_i1.p1 TRINITY_DN3344_c0_g1~~TRINITY_DN3344_c0_g1_i1.p1  ORF type:complete len:550 (+),score=73.98 TRINITY_DN3344_c0_g1_i1:78-1652(+)